MFADLPSELPAELVHVLVETPSIRIERIVSTGQRSDAGFWYDQNESEWVIVLKGQAELSFADGTPPKSMCPGDHVMIPAHQKHRIEWTSPSEPTVWLAIFFP
ncbi:cupin domain-containing protein [Novipirellula galeiformis]|uniref:cupin domain-containing protein n=1 Tax=Novipirellula galeiformis TaxID=2528004 RepID=UPI001E2D584F|nr:cupin domain-containing protein [Novipirellula galeiformis]